MSDIQKQTDELIQHGVFRTAFQIPIPSMGEILREEFLEPMGIPVAQVAEGVHVTENEIQGILCDQERITPDMSIRLGQYFGVSERFFMNLQTEIDARVQGKHTANSLRDLMR